MRDQSRGLALEYAETYLGREEVQRLLRQAEQRDDDEGPAER